MPAVLDLNHLAAEWYEIIDSNFKDTPDYCCNHRAILLMIAGTAVICFARVRSSRGQDARFFFLKQRFEPSTDYNIIAIQ